MRRRIKIIVFVLAVLNSALFVSRAFVYDTNIAHPGLTKLAGEMYNTQSFLDLPKLSEQEIKWLMQGAIEEDTPFRWMNHFFDPIHNVGLKSSYDTAKKWAGNAANQASYSKGDQTWPRAIYYWQKGDKEKALIALGHILHLLEDMTVPAHTRDDAHPEGDPYEVWVKNNFKAISGEWIYFDKLDKYFDYLANYSNNNFYSADTVGKKYVNPVPDGVKIFKDSEGLNKLFAFRKYQDKEYKLLYKGSPFEWKEILSDRDMLIENTVNLDYYSLLAPKAIGAGAGAIKLFFEEVQKQQAYKKPFWQINPLGIMQGEAVGAGENLGQIYQNVSGQLGNLWSAGKKLLWNAGDAQTTYVFFTELFATNIVLAQELKNLEQTGQNLVAVPLKIVKETGEAVVEAIMDSSPPISSGAQNDKNEISLSPTSVIKDSSALPRNDNLGSFAAQHDMSGDLLSGFVAVPSMTIDSSAPIKSGPQNDRKDAQNTPNNGSVVYSGGGSSWSSSAPAPASGTSAATDSSVQNDNGGQEILKQVQDDNNEPPPPSDTTPPDAPIIIEPAAAVIFTASSSLNISGSVSTDTVKLFLNNQDIPMGVAVWNTEANLVEGENIFTFTAQDVAGNISSSSSVRIIKDITGPTTQISAKRISAKELQISWQGNDNNGSGVMAYDLDYQVAEIGAVTSSWTNWKISTTSTVGNFIIEFGKQYYFRVRAIDILGNIGDWTASAAQEIVLPRVVINEIAWAGTKANANDEWMELYNAADYDFDTSGWTLTDSNDIKIIFATGTIIKSGQYFLLERTDDQTISDLPADLIYTGSLHNSGEKLQLKDAPGRVLDEVDASKKWFAGKSDNEKESMERIDQSAAGNAASNWQSSGLPSRHGHDAKNNALAGTPKKFNSSINYLNGATAEDRILLAQFSPYFLGDFTVSTGTILTIQAGVTIKSGQPAASSGFLNVYGALITQGAIGSPIIFTSYRDATQAGNTNTWNDSQTPAPGDWNRLRFYPGSRADLQNTKIFYGNYRSKTTDPNGALMADGAEIIADGLIVSQARVTDAAINLTNSSSTFNNCFISQNSYGLIAAGGSLLLENCLFENNGLQALSVNGANITLRKNLFQNNGWDNAKLAWWNQIAAGPTAVKNSVPQTSQNNFINNNSVNGVDWGGNITGANILDNSNDWPWVSSGFIVNNGAELRLKAGSKIKMKSNSSILVNGGLIVNGAADKKIIFTSWRDDSDGYDSNADGASSTPNPIGLEWKQIKFESGAPSTLQNVSVRYANQSLNGNEPTGSLYINNTPLTIDNLQLEYSALPGVGLHLKNATQIEIKNSVILNHATSTLSHPSIGIRIDGGAPKIINSTVQTFNIGLQALNEADVTGVFLQLLDIF